MQIQPINIQDYNNAKLSFGHWKREVFTLGGLKHRNDTTFFRDGVFWKNIVNYLDKYYKDIPKINVYCFGCSDGSEPFTFVMSALTNLKEKSQKFLPVKASDYDFRAIDKVISNNFTMTKGEKIYITAFTDGQFKRFFHAPYGEPKGDFSMPVFARPELYDNVNFEIKNFLSDYNEIEPKNSVVFARNFWPYLKNSKERESFLKKLYEHLGEKSHLIIGEFDNRGTLGKIEKEILAAGFQKTPMQFTYVKIKKVL